MCPRGHGDCVSMGWGWWLGPAGYRQLRAGPTSVRVAPCLGSGRAAGHAGLHGPALGTAAGQSAEGFWGGGRTGGLCSSWMETLCCGPHPRKRLRQQGRLA